MRFFVAVTALERLPGQECPQLWRTPSTEAHLAARAAASAACSRRWNLARTVPRGEIRLFETLRC